MSAALAPLETSTPSNRTPYAHLLECAIQAPSTRNIQPWRFGLSEGEIRVYEDPERFFPVADPDRREIRISIGCAIENLLIAAAHSHWAGSAEIFPNPIEPHLVARIALESTSEHDPVRPAGMYLAIPDRRTCHEIYLPELVPEEDLAKLSATAREPGVHLFLTDSPDLRRQADQLVAAADAYLFADPAYREELAECILRGNFGTRWLLSVIGSFATACLNTGESRSKLDHELLMSAPVFGLFGTDSDDPAAHVRVGMAFERFWLAATAIGLAIQPMSQLTEVEHVRRALARAMPEAGRYPVQPFRLGFAPPAPHRTARRPWEDLLQ